MLAILNFELTTVFVIFSAIAYFVYNFKRKYDHWKERGIPHVGFSKEFLINFWRKHRVSLLQEIYNELAPLPYGGFYNNKKPTLMILDPALVQNIFIKSFSHFTDHPTPPAAENDPFQTSHLFSMTGQRWKNVRAKISPIFSSGKLRRMNILVNECTKLLDKYLERTLDKTDGVEVRGLFQTFTIDAIGICAFGLNFNAIAEESPDSDDEFMRTVRALTAPSFFGRVLAITLLYSVFPKKIVSYFKLKFLSPRVEEFFYSLTTSAMKNRAETKLRREDLLQLLMDVRAEEQELLQKPNDGSAPVFDDMVCAANAFFFFIAGFDPISLTLSHCLYELALHPDVMAKLYDEIKQVQESTGGKIDYDVLKKMEYLDCVISETLRLHPFVGFIERNCTKAYQLPDSKLVIEENTHVLLPMLAIHLDPRYFPEPNKFKPERFKKEDSEIIPGTYFPFGDGPRICIAQRFAIMEMKAALALIINKYTVQPCSKTEIPLKLRLLSFAVGPINIYLQIRRRKDST